MSLVINSAKQISELSKSLRVKKSDKLLFNIKQHEVNATFHYKHKAPVDSTYYLPALYIYAGCELIKVVITGKRQHCKSTDEARYLKLKMQRRLKRMDMDVFCEWIESAYPEEINFNS